MKAKEIVAKVTMAYSQSVISEDMDIYFHAVSECLKKVLVDDLRKLKDVRNISTNTGIMAAIGELRNKWKSAVLQVNKIHVHLLDMGQFDIAFKEFYPEVYPYYCNYFEIASEQVA